MARVLTPTGYRDAYSLQFGDQVCAFDLTTGAPIVNTLETKPQWVDAAEWERWHEAAELPPFAFVRINGTWLLNSEQSIWRNGLNVCHARDLVVGDVIHDAADHDVVITSIQDETAPGWWRFAVSGDHSYIVDGLTVHNASRFWVLGTGTWDSSTTTNWAASSGGAGGQSVPGSADTVTFDGSSGGGTCTVNFGGAITIQSLTMGAYTGTWDNSVNNNNFTITNAFGAMNFSGSGTRSIKMGTATYTVNSATANLLFNTTNLTLTAGSSTIAYTGGAGAKTLNAGGATLGTVTIAAISGAGYFQFTSAVTMGTLTVTAPNSLRMGGSQTQTITGTLNLIGTPTAPILIASDVMGTISTIAAPSGASIYWCAIRDITFTGSPVAYNSLNCGQLSGITVNSPASLRHNNLMQGNLQ